MAFDIGQRVISKFYGVGTVTSEFFKDVEDDAKYPVTYQRVKFDKTDIETAVMVAKLDPYEDPKPKAIKVKKPRRTDVQAATQGDPELLDLIKSHYFSNGGEAFVSCQAAVREAEAEKLSSISSLSPFDALDYISEATDKSHGAKYYLVVSNGTAGPEFFERVARYFRIEAHTSKNFHQFNSQPLVAWLIKEHGVLPKKRY